MKLHEMFESTPEPQNVSSSPELIREKARIQLTMRVIQNIDPQVDDILLQIPFAAVYDADTLNKRWKRAGFEGALYCVRRKVKPVYRIYLLNKLSTKNFVQDITKDHGLAIHENFVYIWCPKSSSETNDLSNTASIESATNDIQYLSIWTYHKVSSEELHVLLQNCVEELEQKESILIKNIQDSNSDTIQSPPYLQLNANTNHTNENYSEESNYNEPFSSIPSKNYNKKAGIEIMKLLKKASPAVTPTHKAIDKLTQIPPSPKELLKPSKSKMFAANERPLQPFFDKDLVPRLIESSPTLNAFYQNKNSSSPQVKPYKNVPELPLQLSTQEFEKKNIITNNDISSEMDTFIPIDNHQNKNKNSLLTEPLKLLMDDDYINNTAYEDTNNQLFISENVTSDEFIINSSMFNQAITNLLQKSEFRNVIETMLWEELQKIYLNKHKSL